MSLFHNSMQFWDIWTSKFDPKLVCLVHFDLRMCSVPHWTNMVFFAVFQLEVRFVPQRSAICDIWASKSGHFDLQMCFVPPCNFVISPLSTCLLTHGFSEPTSGLSRPTNRWENMAMPDFRNISRSCIFLLLTLLLCFSSVDIIRVLNFLF